MTAPRGPYRTGIRRRQEIIRSASKVFATYGYSHGSLRQIADDVGVTPAALGRHFENKEGLLAAVLSDWDEQVDSRFPGSAEGLQFFLEMKNTLVFNRENRGLIELFLTLAAESTIDSHPAHEFIRGRYLRIVAAATDQLTRARDRGETVWMTDSRIVTEVRGLFAAMDGVQLQWLVDPSVDSIAIFSSMLDRTLQDWTRDADGRRPTDVPGHGRSRPPARPVP